MQLLIFTPQMPPLAHIHTYINNTAAQVWSNRDSVSTASSIGPILWDLSLVDMRQHIHNSVVCVPVEDNKMADAASWLTHLLDRKFISHFHTHFPQSKPWRLLPLKSTCKKQLTTMLHNKQSPRGSKKMPPPGANGGASTSVCKSLRPQRHWVPHYLPPISCRAHPFRPSIYARETYQEEIYWAIPPFDRSNLRIHGGHRPLSQPHGEARLLARTPSGILPKVVLSSNKSAAPTCQRYTRLGHCRPGKHLKEYCYQRSHLGCLILPPPDRRILQGRYRHGPAPLQSQVCPILHWTASLQRQNGIQRRTCSGRLFQPPVHNPEE